MSTKDLNHHENPEGAELVTGDAFENPGLAPHRPRMGDEDPKAAKRSERQVTLIFLISILASLAGICFYLWGPWSNTDNTVANVRLSTLTLGLGLGIGFVGIGVAAVHWAKSLMDDAEKIEMRHDMKSSPQTRESAMDILRTGLGEAGVRRRPLLLGTMAGALAIAPLSFVIPLIGNLGADWDVSKFKRTAWRPTTDGKGNPELYYQGKYRYITLDPSFRKLKASDVTLGSIVHVLPAGLKESGEHFMNEKAKAAVVLVRVDPALIKHKAGREDWTYDGILAYSKICTHVGCPVALYERTTHHLLCPCHQSTFDVTDHARVVFGPAKRALPQLPIAVDDEGYLYAKDDFDEAVGPSYWEREK